MAIANNKDLTHVVRTTQQWQSSYDKYECIPEGVLCIEFTTSGQALAKIGNGRDIFSKLPYIGGTDLTNYYTKSETAECVEEIIKANRFIRIKGILQNKDQLPSHAECGDLYFVISQNQSSSNKYDEYVYSPSNTWENLGSIPIDIDLSEYAKIVYVDEKIDEVNERIDDIERHGTHTHANKDILDLITAAFTAEEKDKLSALYNYDDTELRKLITKASHTHSNKDILDAISAPFTKEDKSKLDRLNPYDDSILKEKIQALERLAHEHSNKRILDRTTASFTTEYERKMRWIRLYTGCTGMEEGIAGLVPAAQAGEEDYVLSGSGEWVPQTGGGGTYELPIATTSTLGGIKVGDGLEIDANGKLSVVGGGGGGDSIAEGDGITITTDPQTGVKTISVKVGDNLEVDQVTGELNVTDVDYEAGQGIHIGADYTLIEYIKNSGNYDQIILTDIIPNFSDKIEIDMKIGAAVAATVWDEPIFGCSGSTPSSYRYNATVYLASNDSNIACYNHFTYVSGNTGSNFFIRPSGVSYDGTNAQRQKLTMSGSTATLRNASKNFSNEINNSFIDPQIGIAIFGNISDVGTKNYFNQCNLTIYGVKLYDSNNTLIHDLRPAERGTDGEAGLYDLVTYKFYGNAGNGSFVKGPTVSSVDDRLISAKIGNGLQFDSNDAIEVNTGDGLSVNQDNELEVNLGSGLQFDANGAIEVTSSGGTDFVPGEGLEMVQEGYFDRLPLETYSHCDYVENTNDAYCQINYIPPQNVRVIGKFSPTQTLSDGPVFGSRTSNNTNGHQFVLWCSATSGNLPYKMGFVTPGNNWGTTSEANSGYVTSFVPNDIINVDADLPNDRFLVNNELLHPLNVSSSATASLNLNIFNCNYSGSTQYKFCGKIYELKFYVGNALAVNLVPAVRDSDNVIGFYDNVNDVFYPSIGNTAFSTDTSTITKHEPSVGIEDVLNVKPATTGNIGGIIPRRALSIDLKGRLDVDLATSTTPGIVIPKEGLNVNANGEVSVAKATSSTMGGLKIGSGIIQAPDGTVNVSAMEPFDIGDGLELEYDSEDALPSGYAYVDYISSNPTSATTSYGQARTIIDYVPNANTRYKVRGSRNNNNASTSRNYFCGAKQSANDYQSALLFTNNGTNKSDVGFLYGSAQWADTKYNIDYVPGDTVVIEADANSLKVDDTTVATYTPAGNSPAFKIGVFGATANGNVTPGWTDNNPMNGKIYYLKIYEGDTLVVNLIPAYRYADDAVGFYDNINDKFYTSITNYPFTTDISTLNPDPENRKLNVVPATANTIGGIKVGDGLSIAADGTLSAIGGSGNSGNYIEGDAIEFKEGASRLPTGYTELENISNTSASYIDTGYIPNTDTQLSIIANIHRGTTSWQTLFGARDAVNPGGTEYAFFVRLNDNYNFYPRITGDQYTYMPSQTYDEKIRININNTTTTVTHQDGSSYSYTQTGSLSNLSTTLAIFALHNQTGYVDNGIIDLYSFKIYENNTIVKDFVPCKRNSDDSIGLIDIINNVFYTNLGTGTFAAGRILTNTSINVNYGNGLTLNASNELEVNIGNGLQFDANGAIEVTGGSGGGDTIAEGDGITITTDSQTGVKTIGINAGNGLDIDPITNELFVNGQLPEGTIIKKMTYVGTGEANNIIHFSKKPLGIIALYGQAGGTAKGCAVPTVIDAACLLCAWGSYTQSTTERGGIVSCLMSYNDSTNELTLSQGIDVGSIFNISGETYQMYYLTKGHAGSGTSETNEVSVVKTLSYIGTGTATNDIQFPETPDMIISINGKVGSTGDLTVFPFEPLHPTATAQYMYMYTSDGTPDENDVGEGHGTYAFNQSTNVLTLTGVDHGAACNYTGCTYYVRYVVNEVISSSNYVEGDGIEINSYEELAVENTEYYFDTQVSCEIHGSFNRTFQKTTSDPALGVIWKCYDNGNLWGGPLFVGLTADSVKYTTEGTTYNAKGSFTYLGKTWYYSDTSYYVQNPQDQDYLGNLQVFTDAYDYVTDEVDAAKRLIDTAHVYTDIDEISVKIGQRLKIEADGSVNAKGYLEGEGISIDTTDYLLPTGYTRIKALSSTLNGNQYINTGYKLNPDTIIDMKCTLYKRGTSVWAIPLGARVYNSYGVGGMLFVTTNSDNLVPSTGVDTPSLWIESSLNYPPSGQINLWYNDIVDLHFDNQSVTCENQRTGEQSVITSQTAISATSNYDLYVFATNNGNNVAFFGVMDLYELTISENNTIIHRYIPCKRDSDDKYGLYDIIDNEFKLSPNNNLFSYVPGLPIDDIDETISLLPATTTTLGGIKIGEGLSIDPDGYVSSKLYEAGQGITFEEAAPEGQFKVRNLEYYFDNQVSWQINGSYGPRTFTRLPGHEQCLIAIVQTTSGGQIWTTPACIGLTEASCKYSNSYDSHIIGPDATFNYKGYTWYIGMNYGLLNSTGVDLLGNVQGPINLISIDTSNLQNLDLVGKAIIDLAGLVVYQESIDVWNSGTGWLNGAYNDSQSDQFWTNWYYTYHSKQNEYFEVPAGAIKMRQIGISNENDSRLQGGGVDCFNSSHHHFASIGCVTDEWVDIPEGTVYLQFGVKWNELNDRTISSSDIKSVAIEFYYDTPRNDSINAKLGNGLEFDQDDAIQVKLGGGLAFDEDGAIEVTGGGGGGDSIDEGDGITITTDSQTGVKTIGINVGDGLDIDPITNELFVNGQLPEGTIIKKLTYMGDGGANTTIQFDKKPLAIITLYGQAVDNKCSAVPTVIDANVLMSLYGTGSTSQSDKGGTVCCEMSYDDSTNVLTLSKGYDAGARYNISGETYQMFYLTKGHTGSGTSVNNEVSVIKTFSYVGDGTGTIDIQFSETPDMIVSIYGPTSDGFIASSPVPIASTSIAGIYEYGSASRYGGVVSCGMSFNDSTNILTLSGGVDAGARFNISGATYTVTYSVNEVIASQIPYDAGEAISIETIGGLQLTNYSNDDFVDSIMSMNAGSIVKAADKSSFTLTASYDDCYTRGSSGQANGSYPFNVKASTKYRFAWDSADPTVHGKVYTYENGLYDAMMHEIDQYDSSYLEFTTSPNTTFIQARFGVMYGGDSITYSNVRLYEVIEDEDQYDEISVKYNKGLSVNQNNELEVNIGTGLAFDPQTGAINVTGGGGGSGDTVAQGSGIEITTDRQTGDKVIAVNAGTGLQVDQTTNELEIDDSVLTEDDELNLVFVPDDYQPS